MTINIFVFKGDLNGENRSGAFLFLSGIYPLSLCLVMYEPVRAKITFYFYCQYNCIILNI